MARCLCLFRIANAFLLCGSCLGAAAGDSDEANLSGVLTTTDGSEIRTDYETLSFTGTARFVWADGHSYSGEFIAGKPNGHGIEQLPDGSTYDGDWIDGLRDGSGTLTLPDGSRYDGQFSHGERNGAGLYQGPAGRYQGEWVDDVPQGQGRFDYIDGASYDGDWYAGRRNGVGSYHRTDGSSYEGDWRNDMPDGYGHLVEPNDYTYDGAWQSGQRSGYGAMRIGGEFGYEGTWVANAREGYGRELRPDGGEYTGEWRADQRDGQGILTARNGASHEGHWHQNAPAGPGTRVSVEGITITGVWDGDYVTDGTITLHNGDTYRGDLYDAKIQGVDPAFMTWLEHTANEGNPDAALLLGQAYRFFAQPPPDHEKARLWFGRAADGGLAEAQYQLAALMFEASASATAALEQLMAAADQGHAAANARLGVFFQLGLYVEKNQARARHYYELATAQGDLTARNNLAWLLATSPNDDLRDGNRALALAQPLAVLYESWGYLDTLAAAQAEVGDFAAASRTEQKAVARAEPDASREALQELKHRLALFQSDQPYRETLTEQP
jgi:TPR repeat protein